MCESIMTDWPSIAQSDNVIALTDVGLSSGKLQPVKGTAHHHAAKATHKIGENYPETGYDSFYLLTRDVPKIPTRLPGAGAPNVIKDIIAAPVTKPFAELASEKSGIKIAFDSNRASPSFLIL